MYYSGSISSEFAQHTRPMHSHSTHTHTRSGKAGLRPDLKCFARPVGKKDPSVPDPLHILDPSQAPIIEIPSGGKASRAVERTSYRKKVDEDQLMQAKEAARRERQTQEANVRNIADDVRSGRLTTKRYKPSVMLIDGYNILHRHTDLESMWHKQPELGRGELESWVEKYARAARIQCLVVYDAMLGRSTQTRYTRCGNWLTVAFSAQSEADSLIVKQAKDFHKKGHYKVVVVSGDQRIHNELADNDQTIVMLDANTFTQHIWECKQGNTTGPQFWKSSWALPTLTSIKTTSPTSDSSYQQSRSASFARAVLGTSASTYIGSGYGSGSESDDAAESRQAFEESLLDSDELEFQIEAMLQDKRKQLERDRLETLSQNGTALVVGDLLSQASSSHSRVRDVTPEDDLDDEDDDLDMDALLTKRV